MSPPTRWRTDIIVSVAATVASLCAVGLTFWQTRIMRGQQQASVWPRLSLSHGFFRDPARAFYRLRLSNDGVGPAILTRVSVRYRGEELSHVYRVLEKALEEHKLDRSSVAGDDHSDPAPDWVVAPQGHLDLLDFKGPAAVGALVDSLPNLQVTIEYTSIYGELWQITYPKVSYRHLGWK